MSSLVYFELIRALTDLIDEAVVAHGGILGKHAGAARRSIETAREICGGAAALMEDVRVNVAVRWGATLPH